MKKTITSILCILLFHLYVCPAYSQTINIKQSLNLNSEIPPRAIYAPWTLRIWYPPAPEPPYINTGYGQGQPKIVKGGVTAGHSGSGAGMGLVAAGVAAPLIIGGGLLAFFLTRGGSAVLPPISPAIGPQISMNNSQGFYNFKFGEEIIYNLVFKNTSTTPIYSDSVMYIKIPAWMDYKPDSTYINNKKLSDLAGDDFFTYFKEESLLVFDVGSLDTKSGISISFGGKVLTNTVARDEAFCRVKFQSIANKYETDWKQLSLEDSKPLPPVLQKVISTK